MQLLGIHILLLLIALPKDARMHGLRVRANLRRRVLCPELAFYVRWEVNDLL
jgi:hypothetical protein